MHANAKLTPLGRAEMIRVMKKERQTPRAAAAARGVCEKTARKWAKRAEEEGLGKRLYDHSCVPIRQPRKTSPELETRIVALRREHKTYAMILMLVPVSKATVSRVLRRHKLNRLKFLEPEVPPPIRYEREQPGELIHLDIKKLSRFVRPGVRGTGNRADRSQGAGVESLHVAIDDHSRLGFACVHPDEKIPSAIAALEQALSFYALHGVKVTGVMTDNGSCYTSYAFADACRNRGIKHIFTRPYRPQTNGKAERFIQTLAREWAYGGCYQSSDQRNAYLLDYILKYNWQRPHGSLNQQPPITRVPLYADNVLRHYS
jgi:transposase InsO family protein